MPLLPAARALATGMWACGDLVFGSTVGNSNVSSATGAIIAPVLSGGATVAVVFLSFSFDAYLAGNLPHFVRGVVAVISSSASDSRYSWSLSGGTTTPLGLVDAHDAQFDALGMHVTSSSVLAGSAPGNPVRSSCAARLLAPCPAASGALVEAPSIYCHRCSRCRFTPRRS